VAATPINRLRLSSALSVLDETSKKILTLRYVERRSIEEIARTLNLSSGVITSSLSQAHRLMQEKTGGEDFEATRAG
jgi:RNA polymerase sigma factor (sigma-70 family)